MYIRFIFDNVAQYFKAILWISLFQRSPKHQVSLWVPKSIQDEANLKDALLSRTRCLLRPAGKIFLSKINRIYVLWPDRLEKKDG